MVLAVAEGRQELVVVLLAVAERDLSSDLAEARRSKASALRLKLMFFLDFFFRLVLVAPLGLLLATLIGSIPGSSSSEVSSSSRVVGRSENPRGSVVMWWG